MQKPFYRLLAFFFFVGTIVSSLTLDGQNDWLKVLAFLAASLLLIFASYSEKGIVYFLLFFLPSLVLLNSVKVSLVSFVPFLEGPSLSVNLSAAVYLFLIAVFAFTFIRNPKNYRSVPLIPAIFLLMVWVAVSLSWSHYFEVSVPQMILTLTPFFLFFLSFYLVQSEKEFVLLLAIIIFSAVVPGLIGLSQLLTGQWFYTIDSSLGRLTGPFHHPNNFGIYLSLMVSILLVAIYSLVPGKVSDVTKKWLYPLLALLIAMLVLTYSRTAWLSLLIFVGLLFAEKIKYLLKAAVWVAMVVAVLFLFETPRERMLETFDRSAYDSINARETIFQISAEKFTQQPIKGYGIGNFEEMIRSEKENFESSSFPHNDLSLFALELGTVGVVLFIVVAGGMLWGLFQHWRKLRRLKSDEHTAQDNMLSLSYPRLARAMLTLFVVSLITGLAEATYRHIIYQIVLWTMLGGWLAVVKAREMRTIAKN